MKTLFIPFAPSLAHTSRCLAVAEACRRRGHDVLFALGPERVEMVRNAGFETRLLPEVPSRVFREDRGLHWLTDAYFEENLQAERSLLAETRPDRVVFDFRFTTSTAASLARIPAISILHGNAIRLARRPAEAARLLLGDYHNAGPARALKLFILRRVFPLGFLFMMRLAARRLSPSLKKLGRPTVASPFALLWSDTVLAADLPELLPADMPDGLPVVGPLQWNGWDRPFYLPEDHNARPWIYVSLGSTVESGAALPKIVSSLANAPYRVILSTGGLDWPANLLKPSNFNVYPFVPGATVARRCQLIIHFGGHDSLMQALAAGAPSLMLPVNPDQIMVARQSQALGVGRHLWPPGSLPFDSTAHLKITPERIRQEVDQLIADPKYKAVCQAFQAKIASCGGSDLAARILEKLPDPAI